MDSLSQQPWWDTPEYRSWEHMIRRCQEHPQYIERGITVCARWITSFEHFLSDMGARPTLAHTLDRIDNSGPYSPDNCRWATRQEQARNRRSNRLLTHNGETLCLSAWAERLGITPNALYMRLRTWPVEKALSAPGKCHRWNGYGESRPQP